MMHPSSEGKFPGVGSLGTGWAEMTEYELGKKCVVKRRSEPYWAGGGHLDSVEYIDHGDDPAAALGALASGQVDGLWRAEISQLAAVRKMDQIQLYEAATAQTAVARMQPIHEPWGDAKIRKAMRLAIDTEKVLGVAHGGLGLPGEHHHVCPIHPEYAKLPFMKQDIEGAKKLLAEAGKPDGFEAELFANADDDWEPRACNAMAEMWKQAGINIKVSVLPGAQYWEIWNKDTAPFAFTSWTHRPLGVMVLGLAYRTGVPWNESFWSNAEFDKLLSEAEGLLDVEERRKVVEKIEVLMQEEGPVVQPLWRSVFMAMDKKVKGFAAHPTQYIFPWDWSLEA
jgi:peptide/nickel transport system substrate-binding protein